MHIDQPLESLTVYTAQPLKARYEGEESLYRNVVGVDVGSRVLYMANFGPGSEGAVDVTHSQPQQETLDLPPDMVEHLRHYYEEYMVDNGSSFNYSCHTFAAALHGVSLSPQEAQKVADNFIDTAQPQTAQRRLNPGEQGVYGAPDVALHSVVGLGRDRDEVIQVDNQGGMVSIVPYEVNHKFFDGGDVEFYAKPEAQTAAKFSLRGIVKAVKRRFTGMRH